MKFLMLVFSLLVLHSCQSPQADDKAMVDEAETPLMNNRQDFQKLLDSLQLTGVVLIFDEGANTYHSNNFDSANTGQLPASTFKIPNTIIALETGVAADLEHVFKWDGTDHWLDAWEQDLTLKEAFAASCVPCYQGVARAVGADRMQKELDRLGYSGMVFDTANVDGFWLGGDSRITPQDQISFLRRIYQEELPIRPTTQRAIREVLIREKTDDFTLSGKTGWSIDGEKNNGWFVGFLERENRIYYFATNVEPEPGFDMSEFAAIRTRVTQLALMQLGVL